MPVNIYGSSVCNRVPFFLVDLLLSMAHLDTFEYYEWVDNFGPEVFQPRFKLSDFVKPRAPQPKFPPQVHVGKEDEFAEVLHAYGAKCLLLRE